MKQNDKYSGWVRFNIAIGLILFGVMVCAFAVFGAVEAAKIAGWLS